MRQSGLLWAAFVGWACCCAVGELVAQQSASPVQTRLGAGEVNVSAWNASPSSVQPAHLGGTRPNQPVAEPSYIAVIGAVKTPSVFETTENDIPLKTLIEQAGGETSESIGSVRIMEHARTRFMTDLQSHPHLKITDGQVIFVVPRGGKPARIVDPRQAPPDRFVLISGLSQGPLLFNIGNQSRTFGDLLLLLGQSPEMLARHQVQATLPHGQGMELDSLLVHNTVIHFDAEAVLIEGVRDAVDRGFRYESPVQLDSTATAQPPEAQPGSISPTPPASTKPAPGSGTPAPQMPVIRPKFAPARITPPVTSGATTDRMSTGIEPAGSSILFDEPMPFPAKTQVEANAAEQAPHIKAHGRAPLMLPKSWQNPEDAGSEAEDPVRVIERTSAELTAQAGHIVTVSAQSEDVHPRQPLTQTAAMQALVHAASSSETTTASTSTFNGPQSWLVLLATIGVAVASVVVTRFISRGTSSQVGLEISAADTTPTALESVVTRDPIYEDEQRFLQRLILNKIPLVEEEATLPPVDRLHGMVIGGRRLVIHEAHEGVAGPHFQVRQPGDTREVELRLRRLLRADRSATQQSPVVVHAAEIPGTRTSRVSPLEKALRTVGRGDTQ